MKDSVKITILDDEEIVCKFIENNFKDEYYVNCFTSEKACLASLKQERPDFLLLDYYLESCTGLDFYEENKGLLSGVEIIFISSQKSLTDMFEVINKTKAKFVIKDENMLKCLEYLFVGDLEAYEALI